MGMFSDWNMVEFMKLFAKDYLDWNNIILSCLFMSVHVYQS